MEAADPDGGERVGSGRKALVVMGQRGAAASYGAAGRAVLRHGVVGGESGGRGAGEGEVEWNCSLLSRGCTAMCQLRKEYMHI